MKTKKSTVAYVAFAIAFSALTFACDNKKTADAAENTDSVVVSDSTVAAVSMQDYAGTYEGTLPAADGPGMKVVLTLQADSTYSWSTDNLGKEKFHDEASGVYELLPGNVFMLVRPSSGERTYYKVKSDDSLIMTDSIGTEPEGETASLYVLTKKK